MTTPQIMALDQALAEVQVPPPDPVRWAGQIADVARQMRAVIGRHRDIIPCSVDFLPGGSRALGCHERVLAILGPAACRTAGLSPACICCGSS